MDEYDYRGYTITEDAGYFYIGDREFYSIDDAMDWVDDMLTEDEYGYIVPTLNVYHIHYVTKSYDRGYDEFVEAQTEEDAIRKLRHWHRDIAYIADCYKVG